MRVWSDVSIAAVTVCSGNGSRGEKREYAEVRVSVEGQGVRCFVVFWTRNG